MYDLAHTLGHVRSINHYRYYQFLAGRTPRNPLNLVRVPPTNVCAIHTTEAAGGLASSVPAVMHKVKEPETSCYQARLVHPSASTALCRSG